MNRHVIRAAQRRRAELVRTWVAAMLAAFIFGAGLGRAGAQDFSTGAGGLGNAGYPYGATPVIGVGTGTTGAVTATLAAAPNRVTYVCGIHIDASGSGSVGPVTLGPLFGGASFTFQVTAGTPASMPFQTFAPCIPGNGINTAISAVTTADGTATAVDVNLWGFQQ